MAASPGQALAGLIQRLSQAVALSAGNQPDVVACHEGLRGVRPGRPHSESGLTVGRAKDLTPRIPGPRTGRLACSMTCPAELARPVIAGRPGPPGATGQHSERRSNDGQVILKAPSASRQLEPDLLVCGAPLRNRTVDLLLTMCNSSGSLHK
jgi:hypothetical protein